MIKRLLRRWIDCPTPEDGLVETLEITIRCARRCAYDLKHASDMISPEGYYAEWHKQFHRNAEHWLMLFQSGEHMKNYRLQLHRELDDKNREIDRLKEVLRKNGINPENPDGIPFR